MRLLKYALIVFALLVSPAGIGGALAQEKPAAEAQKAEPLVSLDKADALFARWESEAAAVDKRLQDEAITTETLTQVRAQLDPHRVNARTLADQAKEQIAPLVAQLDALGSPPEGEATEDNAVAAERQEINKRLALLRGVVSKSDLAYTRADRLIAAAADAQRTRFTNQLLERGPAPIDPRHWISTAGALGTVVNKVVEEANEDQARARRATLWETAGYAALGLVAFAFILLVFVRRFALKRLSRAIRAHPPGEIHSETELSAFGGLNAHEKLDDATLNTGGLPDPAVTFQPSRARRLVVGIGVTLTRLLVPLAALAAFRYALDLLDLLGPTSRIIIDAMSEGLLIIVVTYALAFAFFAPRTPELRLSGVDDDTARRSSFYALVVAVALALDIGLVGAGEQLELPQATLAVMNLCTILPAAWGLWRLASLWKTVEVPGTVTPEGEDGKPEEDNWFAQNLLSFTRRSARLLAIITPVAAVAGYYALSRYVLQGGIFSAAVIAIAVILFLVAREAIEALYEASGSKTAKSADAKKAPEEKVQTTGLLPVFIGFLLALVAAPVLALIWGATVGDLEEVYFGITQGFSIGETVFRPGDILIAALVFGAGLFLTRLFQAVMRRAVMPRTRLDVGARSSIVSGLGYLGFFISALAAISMGGLDLTNLAFLGAALGVGIGFGLQNIVNNFVSGIILLIERPIKVGDWIEVAGTHGTVNKINVRSTEIKTFDKSSYIVPNSELISGAVTNYTHGDLLGRAICPVGVAYGTDVRKVERILLEIARAHPMVVRRPPPAVVFQSFGGSSLDFELRVHLRDVNWVLTVRSDINFEIERRFTEEGIEIPFGQSEVTIKNLPEVLEAVSKSATMARHSTKSVEPDTDA